MAHACHMAQHLMQPPRTHKHAPATHSSFQHPARALALSKCGVLESISRLLRYWCCWWCQEASQAYTSNLPNLRLRSVGLNRA